MMDSCDVILVGLPRTSASFALRKSLEGMGSRISEVGGPEEIPSLLRDIRRATIVVYSPQRDAAAHRTLAAVASAHRGTPVIVLVDRSEFGEYFELMASGVVQYYELSERPELIARGVERAARTRAA